MGEFADLEIDRILSAEHEIGGLFSYGREYPTSIRCKRCGSGPFDWKQFGSQLDRDGRYVPKWRLVDDDGNVHVRPPPDPKKLFDDIS